MYKKFKGAGSLEPGKGSGAVQISEKKKSTLLTEQMNNNLIMENFEVTAICRLNLVDTTYLALHF